MDVDDWKKWSWKYGTADGVVFEGPGWVSWAQVCAKEGEAIIVTFHNGSNENADIKLRLHTGEGSCASASPPKPILFDKGCFVNVDSDTEGYQIQYLEI